MVGSLFIAERPVGLAPDLARRPLVDLSRDGPTLDHKRRTPAPIVAAVDGSDRSLGTAQTAARMALEAGAPLIFVYVRTGPPAWLGKPYYQKRLNAQMAEGLRVLEASVTVARREGVAAEAEVIEGAPARRIREFADARLARLVVLGARRRRLKRSVSQKVIRDSGRPVVVVGE
jgi:nucleotide-binding universal stress UspA family protein